MRAYLFLIWTPEIMVRNVTVSILRIYIMICDITFLDLIVKAFTSRENKTFRFGLYKICNFVYAKKNTAIKDKKNQTICI